MRRVIVLFSLALLISSPASAKDPYENTPTFGKAYCRPSFACTDVTNRDSARNLSEQLAATANACIASQLAMRDPEGYFETSFGLDSNLCLTTKKMKPNTKGLTMTPKCCVKVDEKNPNACQFECTRYGVR